MNEYDNNDIYEGFAYVYDRFMDDIPYDQWAGYLQRLLEAQGVSEGLVLELGCGTGSMTKRMEELGYDMIALDRSADMLELAREKCSSRVLLLQQDMRQLELYGTVAATYCVCDGMNYLLEEQELREVFSKVNNYLDAGGVFLFDMKTAYFYEKVLGNRMITDHREDATLIWDNFFDTQSGCNEYDLTIYQLFDEKQGLYSRCDEHHIQRAYEIPRVIELLKEAGLKDIEVYDAFTTDPPDEKSERIYFKAREGFQKEKYYVGA